MTKDAIELRRWVAAIWDDHLDRCDLAHTKHVDRAGTVEQLAQIVEAHATLLAADAVAKGRSVL